MALALLANTSKRIVSILGANPGVWSGNVSGNVGAFPSDDEILAATLEADEWVATQGYFQSVNQTLAKPFETVSGNLGHNDPLPFHHGKWSLVELSANEVTWVVGIRTDRDAIINAVATESYIQTGAFDHLYAIDDGQFFTTQNFGRITHPAYVRTNVLQCDKNEESLISFRSVAILAKNASPALFDYYDKKAEAELNRLIADGSTSSDEKEED